MCVSVYVSMCVQVYFQCVLVCMCMYKCVCQYCTLVCACVSVCVCQHVYCDMFHCLCVSIGVGICREVLAHYVLGFTYFTSLNVVDQ